jgi:hypothetical protein
MSQNKVYSLLPFLSLSMIMEIYIYVIIKLGMVTLNDTSCDIGNIK